MHYSVNLRLCFYSHVPTSYYVLVPQSRIGRWEITTTSCFKYDAEV